VSKKGKPRKNAETIMASALQLKYREQVAVVYAAATVYALLDIADAIRETGHNPLDAPE
jgi:ACR3 family arsenite efflux pump ArsB